MKLSGDTERKQEIMKGFTETLLQCLQLTQTCNLRLLAERNDLA